MQSFDAPGVYYRQRQTCLTNAVKIIAEANIAPIPEVPTPFFRLPLAECQGSRKNGARTLTNLIRGRKPAVLGQDDATLPTHAQLIITPTAMKTTAKKVGTVASFALWLFLFTRVLFSNWSHQGNMKPLSHARTSRSNGIGKPFDLETCRRYIQDELKNRHVSPTDTLIFTKPPTNQELTITVAACRKLCGDGPEKKGDCVARIKSWMYPVLFLIVSLEPTIGVAVGWSALALYLFALGDPIAMFNRVLCRILVDQHCRRLSEEIMDRGRENRPDSTKNHVHVFAIEEPKQRDRDVLSRTLRGVMRQIAHIWRRDPNKNIKDSLRVILSAMADLDIDLEAAKERFCHALPETSLSEEQSKTVVEAADSIKSLRANGTIKAWIAVFACILDILFLVIPALQEQSSESPSGAKIASGTAFSWLIPLVILHAHYGNQADEKLSAGVLISLFEELERCEYAPVPDDPEQADEVAEARPRENEACSSPETSGLVSLEHHYGGICLH